MKYYKNIESALSGAFSALKTPCECVGVRQTPNTTLLDFRLANIADLPKVKRLAVLISAEVGEDVEVSKSTCGHFALVFKRATREAVRFADSVRSAEPAPFEAVVGIDEQGQAVKVSLPAMVSALCVGTSGSGKSTFLHSFINSLAISTSADKLGFLMIDCKRSELVRYNTKSAHLICKVCTTAEEAKTRLYQLLDIMQYRYNIMEEREINTCPEDFPRLCVIVDELAELVLSADRRLADEIKTALARLCQIGRACGIHCVLCTQSPRVTVVDGLIQSNTPTKFAFRTSNTRESILAIGHGGCERLFGRGDMLFKPSDDVREKRIQAPYITADEITALYENLPPRVWNEPTRQAPQRQTPTLWQRIKTPLTLQDCIDFDLMED